MKEMQFGCFRRIHKREALKRFGLGQVIFLTPSNLRPDSHWQVVTAIKKSERINNLEDVINVVKYYNCNSFTGLRVNFWTTEGN